LSFTEKTRIIDSIKTLEKLCWLPILIGFYQAPLISVASLCFSRYDVVNIDLKSKPEWFLERNPLGKVPAIEEAGKKPLFESLIVAEYLDEKYPGAKQIVPKDAYEKARQKVLIEVISQKVTKNQNYLLQ
jgi:glutathione S-transferase